MKKGKVSKKEMQIIRKVLGNANDNHLLKKEVLITEGVLLALPLLLTLVLYIDIILKTTTNLYDISERLAPSTTEPLLIFMLLFIISYSIFLVFMYKRIKKEVMRECVVTK